METIVRRWAACSLVSFYWFSFWTAPLFYDVALIVLRVACPKCVAVQSLIHSMPPGPCTPYFCPHTRHVWPMSLMHRSQAPTCLSVPPARVSRKERLSSTPLHTCILEFIPLQKVVLSPARALPPSPHNTTQTRNDYDHGT